MMAMLVTGCSKDSITKLGTHALTGRVRLVGALRNAVGPFHDAGDSTDVQLVENADSVRVYLYEGSTLKDSTRAASGGYRFGGFRPGPTGSFTGRDRTTAAGWWSRCRAKGTASLGVGLVECGPQPACEVLGPPNPPVVQEHDARRLAGHVLVDRYDLNARVPERLEDGLKL